jgi:hypothetical protein
MDESMEASVLVVLDLLDRLARQQYQVFDLNLAVYNRASGVIRRKLENIIADDNPAVPASEPIQE